MHYLQELDAPMARPTRSAVPVPAGGARDDVDGPPTAMPNGGGRRRLAFSDAVAQLERHRTALRATLGVALVARLLVELRLLTLLREPANLLAAVPMIGLALLAYLVVFWFLATRTRDRFGFGMALGIGVLEVTFLVVALIVQRPFAIETSWPLAIIAFAHLPMIVVAFHVTTVFPPHDGKRPWIVGFATAVGLVGMSWVAPAVLELLHR